MFKVKVEVVTVTIFEYSTEGIGVDFKDIVEVDDPRMLKVLVNVVFSQGVLNVIRLLLVLPILVELMNLASDITLLTHVEALITI